MSQTSLSPPPDASSATESSAKLTQNHKAADIVVHSAGLSESYVGGLGASANTTDVDQNTQRLAGTSAVQAGPSQFGYYYPTGQAPSSHRAQYAYYPVPAVAWGNPWPSPYAGGPSGAAPYYSYSRPQIGPQLSTPLPTSSPTSLTTGVSQQKPPSVFPPPSPALQVQGHWDSIIREFLSSAGLTQALRGFEADVIVMGPDWERRRVPLAIEDLVKNILALKEKQMSTPAGKIHEASAEEEPFDSRKLQYLRPADGKEPRSQTSTIKDISKFLAHNRARNDASNRQEFLYPKAGTGHGPGPHEEPIDHVLASPSCARTDAKAQNRDVQMKYDIAKNEDGPLRKTLQGRKETPTAASGRGPEQSYIRAGRIPGLDERLRNIETHLAVRYVPSPPRSLLDRLKFLEDHIVQLEREYPPWAALHFNQPHRGWPPPPRPTPIIVPSGLTSAAQSSHSGSSHGHSLQATTEAASTSTPVSGSEMSEPAATKGKGKSGRTKSSLHRAVMEKLEVQRAMHDLAGAGDGD